MRKLLDSEEWGGGDRTHNRVCCVRLPVSYKNLLKFILEKKKLYKYNKMKKIKRNALTPFQRRWKEKKKKNLGGGLHRIERAAGRKKKRVVTQYTVYKITPKS